MAPIQGPLMVPEALRMIKFAVSRAKHLIRTKAPTSTPTTVSLASVRTFVQKPIAVHPGALIKQSKSQYLHKNGTRGYTSASSPARGNSSGPKYDRSSFPSSRTSRAIAQKGVTPFASTLRPNVTGGTLPRSAGGYSLGGAGRARQFSHTSACQAQVVQNVSAGIRAFLVNGSKARFDGINSANGEKKWKATTKAQNTVSEKWEAATSFASCPKGTSLEFQLSPTITALLSSKPSEPASECLMSTVEGKTITLNSPDLLHTLSADFARAFRDLALTLHDLKKLSAFGDLPVSLSRTAHGPLLSVRFPGCDASAVTALCDEAGIRRGLIVEDPAWAKSRDVEMALLFPLAPTDGLQAESEDEEMQRYFETPPFRHQQQPQSRYPRSWGKTPSYTTASFDQVPSSLLETDLSYFHYDEFRSSSISDAGTLDDQKAMSEIYAADELSSSSPPTPSSSSPTQHTRQSTNFPSRDQDYEGVEGIYRFLSAIDDAGRL